MDSPFEIEDTPRDGAPDALADTPLVTIAWRALRAEHARASGDRAKLDKALAETAECAFRLKRAARLTKTRSKASKAYQLAQEMRRVAGRIESALAALEVSIVAPEGEVFGSELTELFESVAQVPCFEGGEPRVREVIEPAVLRGGKLLTMGKAAIAVPRSESG